jgi:predicted metalloprotease with PDZ domain
MQGQMDLAAGIGQSAMQYQKEKNTLQRVLRDTEIDAAMKKTQITTLMNDLKRVQAEFEKTKELYANEKTNHEKEKDLLKQSRLQIHNMEREQVVGVLKIQEYADAHRALQDLQLRCRQRLSDLVVELGMMFQSTDSGIIVYDVTPGRAADVAGLKKGDMIVSINGEKMATRKALQDLLSTVRPVNVISLIVKQKSVMGVQYVQLVVGAVGYTQTQVEAIVRLASRMNSDQSFRLPDHQQLMDDCHKAGEGLGLGDDDGDGDGGGKKSRKKKSSRKSDSKTAFFQI